MEPDVCSILHSCGINVRYLPYVLHRLPLATRPAVEHFLHVELVARAAKYVFQHDMRRTTTALEARSGCEAVLSALLQPTGMTSERFWRTRLGPVLQGHFDGICEPFQVAVKALRAVAERVQALTGVWLSEASLASLDALSTSTSPRTSVESKQRCEGADKTLIAAIGTTAASTEDDVRPFVEIESITPRTWVFQVASQHTSTAAAVQSKETAGVQVLPLRRRLEALLLFWIGHSPDNADDVQQPFYLDESMFRSEA